MDQLKRSFPPAVDERTRLLVLGSLPGEESLARQQYYANPRNQFWRLMEAVIERPLVALRYEERLASLREAGVGLWDTIGSARREGSLDASIRDVNRNDLESLVARLPALRAVAFNGGKSAALGLKQLAARPDLTLIPLPSSSPALTLPFEEKLARWKALREHL
jgi:hypoxanthine-DNA glycosylase